MTSQGQETSNMEQYGGHPILHYPPYTQRGRIRITMRCRFALREIPAGYEREGL